MKEQNLNKAKLIELILEQVNLVKEQDTPPDTTLDGAVVKPAPKAPATPTTAPKAAETPAKSPAKPKKDPATVDQSMIYQAIFTRAYEKLLKHAVDITDEQRTQLYNMVKYVTNELKNKDSKAGRILATSDIPTMVNKVLRMVLSQTDEIEQVEDDKTTDVSDEKETSDKPEKKSSKKKSKSSRGGYFLRAFRKKYQSEFKEKYGGTGRDAFNKFYAELDKKGIKIRKDRQFGRRHAEAYDKLHGAPSGKSGKSSGTGSDITEAEFQAIVKGAREKFVRAGSSEERYGTVADALNKLKTANGGKDLDGRQRRKAIYLISRGPGAKVKRSRLASRPQPNTGAIFQGGGPDLPI